MQAEGSLVLILICLIVIILVYINYKSIKEDDYVSSTDSLSEDDFPGSKAPVPIKPAEKSPASKPIMIKHSAGPAPSLVEQKHTTIYEYTPLHSVVQCPNCDGESECGTEACQICGYEFRS